MNSIYNYIKKIVIIITILIGIYILTYKSEIFIEKIRPTQFASLTMLFNRSEKNIINESGKLNESESKLFWLNSGALFYIQDNLGNTIQGDLPKYSPWRLIYKISNPLDTDNGYHPQNIFRLITEETALNISQSFYVLVVKDNLSKSPNRNESNGIFLISRYQNSDTLYYAGIRVDGTVVIKKKKNGVYHTLAQAHYFEGDPYDRNTSPNLIPKNKWIGIKTTTKNKGVNSVEIEVFLDENNTGTWVKVLSVVDKENMSVGVPILDEGNTGIRSDFMDIKIMDYLNESIN